MAHPVAAQPVALQAPLPGGEARATVRVHPLKTGEILLPPLAFDRPSGPLWKVRGMGLHRRKAHWQWVPVPAFLVEHPRAGLVLVDTGLHASVAADPSVSLGRMLTMLMPVRQPDGAAVPEQLAAKGIDAQDVKTIVLTHLHNDHASGATHFPGATFVVTRLEWEIACAGGTGQGYVHAHFDHPFDWRTVDYADPAIARHGAFERALDLFGDGSIVLLFTPGHTRGHQSVLLRLAGDRRLLLTGDAAYTRRSLDDDLVPIFCADVRLYRRSLREIRAHLDEHPQTEVICGHDAERWATLELVYD